MLPCARIFITSWKEPDIDNMFSDIFSPTIEIKARDSAKDIDVYVRGKIKAGIKQGSQDQRSVSS